MPGENLFIDCAEHDEDEAEGGKLSQDAEAYAEASGNFGDAEEDGESPCSSRCSWRGLRDPLDGCSRWPQRPSATISRISSNPRSVKRAS